MSGTGIGPGTDSARGWVVVGAGFVAMSTVFGIAYSFGAFFGPMAAEFGAGQAATSAVFSITSFLYFMLGSVSGMAVDRFGPRRVLLVGAGALGLGLLLTSRVSALPVGYVTYGLGVGIGVACGYVPMVATVTGWFERQRATALGIAVSGIGVGTVAIAPLAAALIGRYGWRATYLVFGIAAAVLLTVCAFVVAPPPLAEGVAAPVPALGAAVRSRPFRLLYASVILLSLALFVPFVYLAPYAESHGVGAVAAAGLVGVIGAASIAGRLLIGPLADRVGALVAFRLCYLLIGGSYALWLAGTSYGLLVAFAIVLGVGYGGFVALSPAVIADLVGTAALGGLIGLTYTGAGFGGLVGPPLAGVVIEAAGDGWAIVLFMVFGLASWVVLRAVRPALPEDGAAG